MIVTLAYLISLALLVASTVADVLVTNRGIIKGVAVEGNSIIVKVWNDKPTMEQLIAYWSVVTVLLQAPAMIGALTDNPYLTVIGMGPILASALSHYIKGYKAWKKLGA